jgi:hypothetical protein
MPSSKKARGSTYRSRLLILFGVATILLLTSIFQLIRVNHTLSDSHPKFVEQFENELRRVQVVQRTVRANIAEIEAAHRAGRNVAVQHADELADSHAQIAELSKTVHDLGAKYVSLAVADAAATSNDDIVESKIREIMDKERQRGVDVPEDAWGAQDRFDARASRRNALNDAGRADGGDAGIADVGDEDKIEEEVLRIMNQERQHGMEPPDDAWGGNDFDDRFDPKASRRKGALRGGGGQPGGPSVGANTLNDPADNHGPGGKGHLIPHATGAVDPGASARATANADKATRALQENRAAQIREAIAFVWKVGPASAAYMPACAAQHAFLRTRIRTCACA